MKSLLVFYEVESEENEALLVEQFEKATKTPWYRVNAATWITNTHIHPNQLKFLLKAFLFPDDKLLIIELGNKAACHGFSEEELRWLDYADQLKKNAVHP